MSKTRKKIIDQDLNPQSLIYLFAKRWGLIAPAAYENYIKSGRGVMYFDMTNIKINGIPKTMDLKSRYAPENNLDFLEKLLDQNTKDLIRSYDPEKVVVIVIKSRDNQITPMYLGFNTGSASPKTLFESLQKH